jgi:hypothetical protein
MSHECINLMFYVATLYMKSYVFMCEDFPKKNLKQAAHFDIAKIAVFLWVRFFI